MPGTLANPAAKRAGRDHPWHAYVGKTKGSAFLTVPLRDRNGDPIAAVCVVLKSFPGKQTKHCDSRAACRPKMQARVQSLEDLLQ